MTQPVALKAPAAAKLLKPMEAPPEQGGTSRVSMQKAVLKMYGAKPAEGGSQIDAFLGELEFQFNPKEVTIAKTAKWGREPAKKGKTAGPPEFNGADPCKLTVEMFFDATSTQDGAVVTAVEKLFSCCIPTEQSRVKDKPAPPLVIFHWGQVRSFASFVTSVSAKYTLFTADGMPIRAVCSVSLEEMPGDPFKQNPTSGGFDVRRVHRTIAGDTCASLAYSEYDDPAMWRRLAAYNNIDDPLRLMAGTALLMPPVEELIR